MLVEDAAANRKLVDSLEELLRDEDLKASLASNISKIAVRDAANRIVKTALDMLK